MQSYTFEKHPLFKSISTGTMPPDLPFREHFNHPSHLNITLQLGTSIVDQSKLITLLQKTNIIGKERVIPPTSNDAEITLSIGHGTDVEEAVESLLNVLEKADYLTRTLAEEIRAELGNTLIDVEEIKENDNVRKR